MRDYEKQAVFEWLQASNKSQFDPNAPLLETERRDRIGLRLTVSARISQAFDSE